MKVLHVITSLETGGAPRLLENLLPLQASYEDVSLLVYERLNNDIEKTLEQKGIKILCLNEHNYRNPFIIFRMRKIIRHFDIVHVHLFPSIYWLSCAARGLNVKLVYTEHSTFNNRRNKWYFRTIERWMYSRYSKIISISKQTNDALTSWLRQDDDRFVIINNGVDIQKFSSTKIDVIPQSLIMVSRFAPSKDQETVIRAMKYINDSAKLILVGDGENKAYCEELAKNIGVSDRVRFLGSRLDTPELIASSYIGIQSSNWEGFGLTAVEIMACGKPIVASNVDGLKQVVEGAGEIFTLGDVSNLAHVINNLLSDDRYYYNTAEKCRNRAKLYDINITCKKYIEQYRALY